MGNSGSGPSGAGRRASSITCRFIISCRANSLIVPNLSVGKTMIWGWTKGPTLPARGTLNLLALAKVNRTCSGHTSQPGASGVPSSAGAVSGQMLSARLETYSYWIPWTSTGVTACSEVKIVPSNWFPQSRTSAIGASSNTCGTSPVNWL